MRILIVDDHQLFLDGIQHILNKLDNTADVTKCTRADQAIELLESGRDFNLVLVDLNMPGMDGMSILQRMRARGIWLPLVVVSAEEDLRTIKAVLEMGALGFVPKTHNSQQMLEALGAILEGDIYIPADIQKRLDTLDTRRNPASGSHSAIKDIGITRRQHDVLQLLAKGYSNKQIATSLFLTEHTVKAHVSALFSFFSASNRTECVQLAQRQGIIGH